MKKVKIRAFLCTVLSAAMLLGACSQGTAQPSSEEPSSSAGSSSEASEAAGESSQAEAAEEPLVLTGMANLYNTAPAKDSVFWQEMEKTFNVDYTVDWVPTDTYQQKVELVLASSDLPDVMQIQSTTLPSYIKAVNAGAFWDITDELGDFSKYPNFKNNTNQNAWVLSKIKGRNYVVPRTRGNLDSCLMIRKDWLDKLGLEVPTTTEEFADVITKVANGDPDGNGKNDTIGLIPSIPEDSYWHSAFGTRKLVYDEDGGLIHEYLTDAFGDYVEYMRGLYEAGAVAKEFALIKGQQQEELLTTGQSATLVKNAWHKYRLNQETQKNSPGADIVLIPYLEGPDGIAHIYDLGYFGGMSISSQCSEEKMQRILKFFDDMCAQEYYNFVNYGVEGVHWEMKDGAPALTELGQKEVTNSFNAPFIFATAEFAKVDSPLADNAYNLQTREEMMVLYDVDAEIDKFKVLQSDTWSEVWSQYVDEFGAMETKAISGAISMEEFRDYQKTLREMPEFKQAFQEFTVSYGEYFGSES